MKIIKAKRDAILEDKIQVEMSLEELSVILALTGEASTSTTKKAIEESFVILPHYAERIDADVSEVVYDDSLQILRQKGICKELINP